MVYCYFIFNIGFQHLNIAFHWPDKACYFQSCFRKIKQILQENWDFILWDILSLQNNNWQLETVVMTFETNDCWLEVHIILNLAFVNELDTA